MKPTVVMAIGVILAAIPLLLNYAPACGDASYCAQVDSVRTWLSTPVAGGEFSLASWWLAFLMPTVLAGLVIVVAGLTKYVRGSKAKLGYSGF